MMNPTPKIIERHAYISNRLNINVLFIDSSGAHEASILGWYTFCLSIDDEEIDHN